MEQTNILGNTNGLFCQEKYDAEFGGLICHTKETAKVMCQDNIFSNKEK